MVCVRQVLAVVSLVVVVAPSVLCLSHKPCRDISRSCIFLAKRTGYCRVIKSRCPVSCGVCIPNPCDDKECGPHSECIPEQGALCRCWEGFLMNVKNICADINECDSEPCGANEECTNSVGSFECSCKVGYKRDGNKNCIDMNECESEPCGPNEGCSNSLGSFQCSCLDGFTKDTNGRCRAVVTTTPMIPTPITVPITTTTATARCIDGELECVSRSGDICKVMHQSCPQTCGVCTPSVGPQPCGVCTPSTGPKCPNCTLEKPECPLCSKRR